MHVLKHLTDSFNLHQFPSEEVNSHISVMPYQENPTSLNVDLPVDPGFGEGNIESLVVVYESTPGFEKHLSVEGKGYRFIVKEGDENGTYKMNVVFPKYPYPKGPVK